MRSAPPLPRPEEKAAAVEEMFDRIAGRYDLLNRVLTFGLDSGWRRRAVRALDLAPGARVLDLACGTGDLCRELDGAGFAVAGFDVSAGMLAAARTSVPLVRADVARLPVADRSVDGVTCGFALRNLAALAPFLAECARVLRPGGRFAFLEVAQPTNPVARAGHRLWFERVVPLVGGVVSDRAAYRYLPASTAYLPAPDELAAALAAAGFDRLGRARLGLGAAQLLTGMRR